MYICVNCHAAFAEPDRDTYKGESWNCCPKCGCDDFEAAKKCRGCGRECFYTELAAGEYCADCMAQAVRDQEAVFLYLAEPDVRENFADFLAEINWGLGKEERCDGNTPSR